MTLSLEQLIEDAARQSGVPRDLVQAICLVESSMNQWAIRFEAQYRWLSGNTETMSDTERMGQKTSWGLMQVMGAVARDYGFTGWFPMLCDPATGLKYGTRHLARFYQRHQNWPDAIASYNAGAPRRTDAGPYVNQRYVDDVLREWDRLETHVEIKASET